MKKSTNLLIDADILIHRFAHVGTRTFCWDGLDDVSDTNYEEASKQLDDFVTDLMDILDAKTYLMCLSCPSGTGFREEILPCYKAHRGDKPELYTKLRDHVINNHPSRKLPKLEADDLMGIFSTREPGKHIICTIDKDLDQIPGAHYNWLHDDLYNVIEEEGEEFFWLQILTGDSVDNYKGIPGIGPVKAAKILGDVTDPYLRWELVVKAHHVAYLDAEYALRTARVARMLRHGEYDLKTNEPILWEPVKQEVTA